VYYWPLCANEWAAQDGQDHWANLGDDLLKVVQSSSRRAPLREQFDRAREDHRMLLIADFVDLCMGVGFQEMKAAMSILGYTVNASELRKNLHILEKLEIVRSIQRGMRHFYFPVESRAFVEYSYGVERIHWNRSQIREEFRGATERDFQRRLAYSDFLAVLRNERPGSR